jgi:hypothetical protein
MQGLAESEAFNRQCKPMKWHIRDLLAIRIPPRAAIDRRFGAKTLINPVVRRP